MKHFCSSEWSLVSRSYLHFVQQYTKPATKSSDLVDKEKEGKNRTRGLAVTESVVHVVRLERGILDKIKTAGLKS